jgi:hypothetical protein
VVAGARGAFGSAGYQGSSTTNSVTIRESADHSPKVVRLQHAIRHQLSVAWCSGRMLICRRMLKGDDMTQIRRLVSVDTLFIVIWVATAVVFFIQARAAYSDESTALPPYSTTIPSNFNVQIGNVRFQDVINGLTASYNSNVAALQESIRASAKLSFGLNLMSGFLALVGMAAQIGTAVSRPGNAP